ncbi:craniofacial development protein 2-like [Gordionus sp. m RMFG-2023]|uniref:craniofacial development protein 2-like n=1 Tax=Gordionus sp. m RMFG-2023 TaxID=3053472 RepID=UPI0031FBAC8F
MKETNGNMNMKAKAFPPGDAQGVDLHPVKSKVKVKAKTRLASLNIGMLEGKTRELASMLNKRKVDIACIQETKWKGQKTLMIGDGYKLYYNGIVSNRNGVGIILSQDLTFSVVEFNRISDRLMKIKLCISQSILHILSVYAPQTGCKEEEKDEFRAILDEAVMEIPKDDLVIIGGDLNAHVGKARDSYKRQHGGFGYGERNEGEHILKFAQTFDLAIDYMLISRRRLKDVITAKSSQEKV